MGKHFVLAYLVRPSGCSLKLIEIPWDAVGGQAPGGFGNPEASPPKFSYVNGVPTIEIMIMY